MKKYWPILALLPALLCNSGCSVGNAPDSMSPTEVKSTVDKLPPEKQIEWYERSPMSPAEKAQKIAEIKAKAGMSGGPSGQGAPGAPSVPQAGG